jgi:hypothetical protein
MDPTNPLAFLQNIFGSLSPGLQPGQTSGAGMPMNILPPVAQGSTTAPSGGGLIGLAQGNSPSGGLMGLVTGSPSRPTQPATQQVPQQALQNMQMAPAPLAPLQLPRSIYANMLSALMRRYNV